MSQNQAIELIDISFKNSMELNKIRNEHQSMSSFIDLGINISAKQILDDKTIQQFKLSEVGTVLFPFTSFGNVKSYDLLNFH